MKYRNISIMLLLSAGLFCLSSCDDEDLKDVSVFEDVSQEPKNEFDRWLDENYRKTYNIDFKYRYSDKEADLNYNVTPAEYDKAVDRMDRRMEQLQRSASCSEKTA